MAGVDGAMTVADAARRLDVAPAQVRELVRAGELDATKLGRELLIDPDSVWRRLAVVRPEAGRPLSPRQAWAVLWLRSGRHPGWLTSAQRARAHRYAARGQEIERWPAMLRRRARVHRGRMLRAQLDRLRGHPDTCAAGVSAAGHHGLDLMETGDEAELYLPRRLLDELRQTRRVSLGARNSNVVLRVPALDEDVVELGEIAPPAVIVADLLDRGNERTVRAAGELLGRLDRNP